MSSLEANWSAVYYVQQKNKEAARVVKESKEVAVSSRAFAFPTSTALFVRPFISRALVARAVRSEHCGRVFVSRAVASTGDVCPTRLGVVRDLQFAQAADSSQFQRRADTAEAAFAA